MSSYFTSGAKASTPFRRRRATNRGMSGSAPMAWRCSAMTVSMRASHSFNSRSRASALAASRAWRGAAVVVS